MIGNIIGMQALEQDNPLKFMAGKKKAIFFTTKQKLPVKNCAQDVRTFRGKDRLLKIVILVVTSKYKNNACSEYQNIRNFMFFEMIFF